VPSNVGKFLVSYADGGFSRRAQLHGVSYVVFLPFENFVLKFMKRGNDFGYISRSYMDSGVHSELETAFHRTRRGKYCFIKSK
jgi:hypothetical protein